MPSVLFTNVGLMVLMVPGSSIPKQGIRDERKNLLCRTATSRVSEVMRLWVHDSRTSDSLRPMPGRNPEPEIVSPKPKARNREPKPLEIARSAMSSWASRRPEGHPAPCGPRPWAGSGTARRVYLAPTTWRLRHG